MYRSRIILSLLLTLSITNPRLYLYCESQSQHLQELEIGLDRELKQDTINTYAIKVYRGKIERTKDNLKICK
jgi:hypothetical protein